jgi:hypothetical protein
MKYNRLPFLTNTYPQTGNYISNDVKNTSLFGIYADVNKIQFNLPNISNISVVSDTRFRSIISIYKDRTDNTPKYYTSEFYHRDLEASKIEANPYFISYSVEPASIIKIYISDIVDNVKKFREEELKLGVNFARNNFLLYNSVGLVKNNAQSEVDTSPIQTQLSSINSKLQKLEAGLLTADTNIVLKRGLFYGRNKRKAVLVIDGETFESPKDVWNDTNKQRQSIKSQVTKRINDLKAEKKKLDETVQQSVKNKFTLATTKKQIILDETKVDRDLKKLIGGIFKLGANTESDIIEIDDGFIDCIYLVRYIDWILSPILVSEIETNGVIPSETLSLFKVNDTLPNTTTNENGENINNQTNIPQSGLEKSYTYQIIRLSIPASMEQSVMTFVNEAGVTQTIQTDKYGAVGTYCAKEDSFSGNYTLYQRIQLQECGINSNEQNDMRRNRGGNPDYYNDRLGNTDYIDYNRDNAVV